MESSQHDISKSYTFKTWYISWEWWVDYLINFWKIIQIFTELCLLYDALITWPARHDPNSVDWTVKLSQTSKDLKGMTKVQNPA